MNLLTLTIYTIWFISEILINVLTKSKTESKNSKDKNSLRIIWLTIAISIAVSVLIATNFWFPISVNGSLILVGLSLIILGVVLRLIIIKSLGAFFTSDVAICETHQLKTDGFYAFLRHPSYFASLLSFMGFGLSLNNWISCLIITISIFTAFMYRIKVEETALIHHFGTDYLAYKKRTKALIPFIY